MRAVGGLEVYGVVHIRLRLDLRAGRGGGGSGRASHVPWRPQHGPAHEQPLHARHMAAPRCPPQGGKALLVQRSHVAARPCREQKVQAGYAPRLRRPVHRRHPVQVGLGAVALTHHYQ